MKIKLLITTLFVLWATAGYTRAVSGNGKKHNLAYKKKYSADDARELCLINLGASISDDKLKKCTIQVQKTGKIDGKKIRSF